MATLSRRRDGWVFCLALFAALLLEQVGECESATKAPMQILYPLYAYPEGNDLRSWTALQTFATKYRGNLTIWAIVGVDSGPGEAVDPTYKAALLKLRKAGVKILGYIPTGYGQCFTYFKKRNQPCAPVEGFGASTPIATVYRYVGAWPKFYGAANFDGFFLDEFLPYDSATANPDQGGGPAAVASALQDYVAIYKFIKKASPRYAVFGNAGYANEAFRSFRTKVADVLTIESTAESFLSDPNDPDRGSYANFPPIGYGKAMLANTVQGKVGSARSVADAKKLVALAAKWGAKYFSAVRTYDVYPSDFFPAEVSAILATKV